MSRVYGTDSPSGGRVYAAPAPQAPQKAPGLFSKLNSAVQSFADTSYDVIKGAAKGAGSTLFGLGKLGQTIANPVEGALGVRKTDVGETPDFLKPQNAAQKAGFATEQILEFLAPGSVATKGAKAASAAVSASGMSNFLKGASRVALRAGAEGAAAGAVRAAQTGSFKEGAKAGAITAGIVAPLSAAGEALRASGISEKLYGQIFKNSYDDMTEALRTGALKDMQQRFPDRFKELVDQGLIKAGPNGVQFDPTLAREALDRNLKGSLKNMANEVVRKTLDLEEKARKTAAGHQGFLEIPQPDKYTNLLRQIGAQYKGTFLEGRTGQAMTWAKKIESGKLTADDALELRRFLDKMRIASSYRPSTHLSIGQEDFKKAADQLRGVVNAVPGMEGTMNEYRFYIQALESLAKEAAKRSNAAVINLIDTALFGFGGGLAGPQGAAAFPLARRALTLPSVVTGLGSKIEQGTKGTASRLFRSALITNTTGTE